MPLPISGTFLGGAASFPAPAYFPPPRRPGTYGDPTQARASSGYTSARPQLSTRTGNLPGSTTFSGSRDPAVRRRASAPAGLARPFAPRLPSVFKFALGRPKTGDLKTPRPKAQASRLEGAQAGGAQAPGGSDPPPGGYH